MYQTDEATLQTIEPKQGEILPVVESRSIWRDAIWPALGSALIWAGRELLPEVLAAWRASRTSVVQPINYEPSRSRPIASVFRRAGRRHRWGRA